MDRRNRRRTLFVALVGSVAGWQPAVLSAQAADPFEASGSPQLQLTEVARIGGYDDRQPYTFSTTAAGTVLSGNEIALVDRHANEIRVFDVGGVHVRTFGGSGDGPGEFRFLRALQPMPGGTLLAWDFQTKRLTLFDDEGELLRTLPLAVPPAALLWASFAGAFPDGSVVLRYAPNVMALRDEPEGYRADPTYFVRYREGEQAADTLCAVMGPEKYLYHQGRSWGLEDRLFERDVVGAVVGDALLCGATATLDLERHASTGETRPGLAHPRSGRAVSRGEVEEARLRRAEELKAAQERRAKMMAQAMGGASDPSNPEMERLEKLGAYPELPAFRSILAGSDGTLWIEDYPRPGDGTVRWVAFVGDRAVGWTDFAAGETLLAAGHGLLLKRVEDELGVQTVIVMRITEGG